MPHDTPIDLGTLPPVRSHSGDVAPHSRLDSLSDLMLWLPSIGAIDVNDSATTDTIADIVVSTHPGEDLLGGDTVTWSDDDATFAALIAAKINEKSAEHQYWARAVGDHVLILPKNPWVADTGTITVDDTGFTAAIEDMNGEQAFAAGVRVPSGAVAGIPDTKIYAVGFDHTHLPADARAYLGSGLSLDGKAPGRYNFRTTTPWRLTFQSDQITTWFDVGGGVLTLAADTDADRHVYQWREVPWFVQAAAAAEPQYVTRAY